MRCRGRLRKRRLVGIRRSICWRVARGCIWCWRRVAKGMSVLTWGALRGRSVWRGWIVGIRGSVWSLCAIRMLAIGVVGTVRLDCGVELRLKAAEQL